jgi:hypothetical protein
MVITDITTSEGSLKRFSLISKLFYPHALTTSAAFEVVKRKFELTNKAVVYRHFRIMEKLGVLKRVVDGYALSSGGRALYEFVLDDAQPTLNPYEKIFYFDAIFGNPSHSLQFQLLIDSVAKHSGNKDEIIRSYFEAVLEAPARLWPKNRIKLGLNLFVRDQKFPRSFTNRFGGMESWLKSLGILEGRGAVIKLSRIGEALHLNKAALEASGDVFSFASIFINREPYSLPHLIYESHKMVLMDFIRLAYEKFEVPQLKVADAQTIEKWVRIALLVDKNLVIEKKSFEEFIHRLYKEGELQSVTIGRDGKLAYVKI